MQPSTFEMRDFDSKFSGNVIEICPVGALTSTKYRFRARPWDLQTRPATCTLCSNGCSVHMDYRADEIVRINGRTNEAVNEEWTCDRGKFGHYKFNSDKRLKLPHVRNTNSLSPVSWAEAYASILGGLDGLKGPEIAVIAGGTRTNEDLFTLKHLFHDTLVSNVHELAALLEHLNPTNNPHIDDVRKRMENDLCRFEPEVLRKDLMKRALVAKLASELLEEMRGVGVS